jgi:hypothetical protein
MNSGLHQSRSVFTALLLLLPFSFFLFLPGCQIASVIANAAPEQHPASYTGLAGQSVGVMVWADRGVRIDWPRIQIDLATLVQNRLRTSGAPEVKDSTWPAQPASIVKFQHDYPSTELAPITETATKLGVSRLIYIEVQGLSTRAAASLMMYRGSVNATVKVVEVTGGQAKIGYEEPDIKAVYPPKSPEDGVVNGEDTAMYRGVVAELATQIVHRFTSYEQERRPG